MDTDTQGILQVCAAMSTVLLATLDRVPEAVLRSKFAASSEILCWLVDQHAEQVQIPLAHRSLTSLQSHAIIHTILCISR